MSPFLGDSVVIRQTVHCVIWLIAVGLLAVGVYDTTQRRIGLRLEDFSRRRFKLQFGRKWRVLLSILAYLLFVQRRLL
jgi:hypothetical protein